MNIDIEIDTQVYEYLLLLALKEKISLNLLIERYLTEVLSIRKAISKN